LNRKNIIKLSLDWTPNTNHIGFFIANELGFYKELGLKVKISDPSIDNYELTPAKKLELGKADVALCPTESILSFKTKKNKFDMIGIAAIYKEDLSAIAVKKDLKIDSPKLLDNMSYASYNAKYEDKILQKMVINDGGKGDIKIAYPSKLGIWNTIVSNEYDSTWIFINWEGVQAKDAGINLNLFKMSDYKIPYSYSPIIAMPKSKFKSQKKDYSNFLKATKKGFIFAKNNQKEAINIFEQFLPEDEAIDLGKSLKLSAEYFGTELDWGIMDIDVVERFLKWLRTEGLELKEFSVHDIISNELLQLKF